VTSLPSYLSDRLAGLEHSWLAPGIAPPGRLKRRAISAGRSQNTDENDLHPDRP
jgi:hypothetical protein